MGQRLVIKMMDNSEENDGLLATGYYHWSGYTSSSFSLLKEIVEEYLENEEEYNKDSFNDHRTNNLFKAIRLLENSGAGLTDDLQKAKDIFNGCDFKESSSRNEGLIDISKEGMNDALFWAEALIEINLDEETISFQAFSYWDLPDYYNEEIFWNFGQVDNESDYRKEDIERINNYFEMGLLTENSKKECLKNIDDGMHLEFEDPLVINEHLNWYNFKFEDINTAEEILLLLREKDCYSFVMGDDKSVVISLIE